MHVCGDSKCSTILHFTCTVKCKIHKMHDQLASYTCNFKCDHMAQKKLNFFATREASTSEPSESETSVSLEDDRSMSLREGDSELLPSCVPSECDCQCCRNISIPYPLHVSDSKVSHAHKSKERKEGKLKAYSRKIQPSWYEKYPWISVCTSRFKIFCTICRHAKQQNFLTFSKCQSSTFIEEGFGNWRKALQRFQEHEKSMTHREATMKIAASSSTQIATRLNNECAELQKFRRIMLMKVLSCIRYLARQGLPLRGHNNDIEGNLHQLLLLQVEDNYRMKEWVIKREYISPSVVNEIVVQMGQVVLREILGDIRTATWFSLIADEATDYSHNEQLSLSIRWVDSHYTIHEDTLGLVQLENMKANTLYSIIKDILIRCSLPIAQCRGQAFDGASNMSGAQNGVQALVKKEANRALYVHCLAHSLNLCIQEVSKKCDFVRNVMDLIYELVQLIKFSPKRQALFDHLRKEVAVQTGGEVLAPSLRTLCPTR